MPGTLPAVIAVRGARHNNLQNIDIDVPLWRTVAVVGVSGSGKTSLAIGTLYAEGLHRLLEGLSTYSRRRLTQAQRPDVDRIDHLPPALALRQRPPIPGPRSTVGTMSEVLNVVRLMVQSGWTGQSVELSVNYDNAVAAVERSLRSDNERSRRLVQRFLVTRVCSVCHGSRLRPEALTSQLGDRNLAEISSLALAELGQFMDRLAPALPVELSRMTTGLLAEHHGTLTPLLDVGLGYLTLDRSGSSLSSGERQRIELTSTVRSSTTGMLYVLDEPSVGLHPINTQGLLKTMSALVQNGNSVVVVEHERELVRAADWVIELGPGAGASGGTVIAQGTPDQLEANPRSIMSPFLAGACPFPVSARHGPVPPATSPSRSPTSTTCTTSAPTSRCSG